MNIKRKNDTVDISSTFHELTLINNALNEICNGPDSIDDIEFHTRTGSTKEEALSLLDTIGEAMNKNLTEQE